jgi:hypothetical protein
MPANRFPVTWPPFRISEFKNFMEAYQRLRDFVRSINDLRVRIVIVCNDHADRLTPTEDAGAPASTPDDKLLFYINSSNGDIYVSTGTASAADWKKISP